MNLILELFFWIVLFMAGSIVTSTTAVQHFNCSEQCQSQPDLTIINMSSCNVTSCNGSMEAECSMSLPTMCTNETCNATTGECLHGCVDGYAKPFCDKICPQNCPRCTYDQNTTMTICEFCIGSHYLENDLCAPCPRDCVVSETSPPSCFLNGTCRFGCPIFQYGPKCDTRCTGYCKYYKCDRFKGDCPDGCQYRYCGGLCTRACSIGCFSEKCDIDCKCERGCRINFYGNQCLPCPRNCASPSNTISRCNSTNGYCLFGCKGDRLWGTYCDMLCSSTCVSGVCLQEDGNCTQGCESSWYGENCELRCNSNCVNKTCSQTDGTCIKGCKSGWHGSQCDRKCSVNCYDLNCKQSTGECVGACNVGWFGPTCEMICSKTCIRHICETNDGNCTYGCDEGFEGQNCQTQITIRVKPQISNPLNYIMIAGSTTLIFLIGVAAACCSRSRNNCIQNIRIWYRSIYKCTLVKDLPSTRNVGDYMQLDLSTCNHEEAYGTLKLSDDAKTRMAARDTFYAVIAMSPDRIRQEFWRLSTDVTNECIVAKLPENISKNSFEDVFPYDENRVVLQAKDGLDNMQPGSDYINASYIRVESREI